MSEGIKKFEELLRTDKTFQEKLKAAAEAYTGEKTEEAVFNGVLIPVAKEYGISSSYEEFKDYMENLADSEEMNKEELKQVAGGKGGGFGGGVCDYVGVGFGGAGGDGGGIGCVIVGGGTNYGCLGVGEPDGHCCPVLDM